MASVILPNDKKVSIGSLANGGYYNVKLVSSKPVDSFILSTEADLATNVLVNGAEVNQTVLIKLPAGKTILYAKASGVESAYTEVTLEYTVASAPANPWTYPTVPGKAYMIVAPTACKIEDVKSKVQLLDYTTVSVEKFFIATGSQVTTATGAFDGQVVPVEKPTVVV